MTDLKDFLGDNPPPTRKEADLILLHGTQQIAKDAGSLYLRARSYLFYIIVRCLGGFPKSADIYTGCGISNWWATDERDPFYRICQIHDALYVKIKR